MLVRAIVVGAALSLLLSYLLRASESGGWNWLSIVEFQVSGVLIHWSWPVFGVATAAAWLLQKLARL